MLLGKLANQSIFASFGGVVPPNTVEVQELLPGDVVCGGAMWGCVIVGGVCMCMCAPFVVYL